MKVLRDIDREQEPICAIWKNSPGDPKSEHTRILVPVKTSQEEIRVCTKCQQDMIDIVAFRFRIPIAPMQSRMLSTKVEIKSKKEIIEFIEKRTGVIRRKRIPRVISEASPAPKQSLNIGGQKLPSPPVKS